MRSIVRCGVRLAAALTVILCAAEPAGAVTFSASLDPIRVQGRPGEIVTTHVRLTLSDGEPHTRFRAQVEDWWRSEDGRQSFYAAAGTLERSCGPWVSVNPVESSVAGGETLSVRVTVSVPSEVNSGGYWCALTLDEIPDPLSQTQDGVGVRFLTSLSTGIYVSVDPVERDARITAIDFAGDQLIVGVRNTGNTPVAVEGRVEFVRPGEDRPVAAAPVPRNMLLLDPVPAVQLATALPALDVLPSGRYLVRVILDIGLEYHIGVQRELDVQRAANGLPRTP